MASFPFLVSRLSFICLPLVSHSGSGWSHDFLHLSPIFLSFVSHLAPTLGRVGRMISFTCLPLVFHLFPLVSHSGSGWSHDFLHLSPICLSFVFHLSPTLGPVGRMISFTCLPFVFHLSPAGSSTLGLVGRMISLTCLPFVFHLSPTCLPLWVWLVA